MAVAAPSSSAVDQGIVAEANNDAGITTGNHIDAQGVNHGFMRAVDGKITTFDAPGAGSGSSQGPIPVAISSQGAITGYYIDAREPRLPAVTRPTRQIVSSGDFARMKAPQGWAVQSLAAHTNLALGKTLSSHTCNCSTYSPIRGGDSRRRVMSNRTAFLICDLTGIQKRLHRTGIYRSPRY